MRFGTLPSVAMLLLLPLAAKQPWKALIACGAGLLVGLAPYLLWSRLVYGGFFSTLHEGWTHVEGPEESIFFYLRNSATILTPVAVFGLVVTATSGLWRLVRAPRPRPVALAANFSPLVLEVFLWLWLLTELVFFSVMPHKEPRYILPLAPPFLLLAGSGLAFLCARPRTPLQSGPRTPLQSGSLRPIGALLVVASLVLTFLPLRERFRSPFIRPDKPEEMLASQFLQSRLPSGTTLYMNFNYPAFAFYTDDPIHELPAVGPALYHDIEQIPPGGILIVYRKTEEVWEPDIEWVNANPKFQRLRDFSTFVIYRRVAEAAQ
jgi:hypothetical protein